MINIFRTRIKEGILAGEFPTKVYSFALNGWGYGASMFYQDYLLYLPALLRVFRVDISCAYKIVLGVLVSIILKEANNEPST